MATVTIDDDGYMTLRDAAAVLGVTRQTVTNWTHAGCPHRPGQRGRNGSAAVRLREVMDWKIQESRVEDQRGEDGQAYNEGQAKAADWHYRAISRQAQARRDLGQLVAVDHVAAAVEADYEKVRSGLNSVATKLSVKIAAETDAAVARRMISDEISNALGNLSATDDLIRRSGGDPDTSVHDHVDLDDVPDDEYDEQQETGENDNPD